MIVEIDKNSGFCFGVVYAITIAEEVLRNEKELFCLGDIVHNNVEVSRLKKKGLITINHEQFKKIKNCKVLIRAHGEPPETYKIALENNIELVDTSCPVVLKLQNKIKMGYDEIIKHKGQVVIYGKKGHAEVNGLVGQINGEAIIVNEISDLDKIDFTRPVSIFSQTTQSTDGYNTIIDEIQKRLLSTGSNQQLISNNSICRQVSSRRKEIINFAKKFDIIIFVSGKKSSNGKILYTVCKTVNPLTYFISGIKEINKDWFQGINSAGICGATSTPMWLMEKIANKIKTFSK
jgi:4-hydroxy-3-methylbut-2-en-1-yl diphosphate reductase